MIEAAEARRERIGDSLWLIGIVSVVLAVTGLYVSCERTFYYWDQAAYQDIAAETASAFRESTGAGLSFLHESYRRDYNALFALPLLPWLLGFGESRLVFELALALCYLVPFALAIGALAARLVRPGGRRVLWPAAILALLAPMSWVPTLRGFPDSGAATLMLLATLVFLEDDRLRRPRSWLRLGALLGLAVVFRRHFAYAVAAFLVAIVVHAVFERVRASRAGARADHAGWLALRVALVAACALATAVLLAPGFVRRMLEHDYPSLYRSYEMPLGALGSYFAGGYGWAALLLAGAGFAGAALSPRVDRRGVGFVLLFAGLQWGQWCLLVRQVGEQYTLHFTPALVLGLVLLLHAPPRGRLGGLRAAAGVLVVGSSVANFAIGLWGVPRVPARLEALFADGGPPLVRPDHAEVLELVRVLRTRAAPASSVYLVASSTCLNASIVRSADRVLGGAAGALEVLSASPVDSDGYYPVNELLATRLVVLARPFQHHLAPREQLVLRTVYDTFAGGLGIARDFVESERVFRLDGCTVSIFERQRPTAPATALALLDAFEERVPRRPGMQPEWVVVDQRFSTWLTRNPDASASLTAHPAPREASPSSVLAALDGAAAPIASEGRLRFHDDRCQGATLGFFAMAAGGSARPLAELSRRPEDDGRFHVPLELRPAERLFLSLLDYRPGASIDYCLLTIDPLVIVREAPPDVRR